jgi:hypothetical protein
LDNNQIEKKQGIAVEREITGGGEPNQKNPPPATTLTGNGSTHRRRLTQPSPTISSQIISSNVLHFRPNPIGKYRKTQIQPQKSILMSQN